MDNHYTQLRDRLEASWAGLPDKPHETPETTLEALQRVAERDGVPLEELVERRIQGEPLAYLTGVEGFMGIELEAGPGAMIPRRETELLGRTALDLLRTLADEAGSVALVDLCTGSGNLVLALAAGEHRCTALAGDISADAVSLAQRNCMRLGLQGRVDFLVGDFLEPFKGLPAFGQIDLLVCNPPYISSGKVEVMANEIAGFEPRAAFDGGPLGISILMRLAREAHLAIRPGGWVACEVGLGQGESLRKMFLKTGVYDLVEAIPDGGGQIRVIRARKSGVAGE